MVFTYRVSCHIYMVFKNNGAVSKVKTKPIFHLTRVKCTPSAESTVQVSHALPAVCFSCLPRPRNKHEKRTARST
jgi:hypothetical protein